MVIKEKIEEGDIMKNKGIIAEICNLSEQLELQKNKSLTQLLKEFNISRDHPTITSEEIKEYLKGNTDLIESWLLYSMNKRTSEGWYFIKNNTTTYMVGYLLKDSSNKELEYSDPAQACAVFIYNELFRSKCK